MSIKICHGSDQIIENPRMIISEKDTFGKELGDGFYVFQENNKERALEYAVDTYLYNNRENNIIINYYEFKINKFAEDAIKEFEERLLEDEIDLIVSNIIRIKIKNCQFFKQKSIKCDNCNYECPKNKDIVMTLLVDKFLDSEIIGKNFDSDLTREKLTEIINEKFQIKSDNLIKQLRISGNIKNYIKYINYEKFDVNNEKIKNMIVKQSKYIKERGK